jgi:hypothetical protein
MLYSMGHGASTLEMGFSAPSMEFELRFMSLNEFIDTPVPYRTHRKKSHEAETENAQSNGEAHQDYRHR